MTCIAGIAENGTVTIGADSAASDGSNLRRRGDAKVFRNRDFLIGFTDSFRMGQVLRYAFVPPEHDPQISDIAYMATLFVDGVRQCLKDGGYAQKEKDQEQAGCFMVGYRGQLFEVHGDYQVAEPRNSQQSDTEFAAIGSGAQVALGALAVLDPKRPSAERLTLALAAAERFCAGVKGPFVIKHSWLELTK